MSANEVRRLWTTRVLSELAWADSIVAEVRPVTDHTGAFVDEEFGSRQAYAASSARKECCFSFEDPCCLLV